jgi:GDPmannose 4,6-dehydratase
VLGWTPEITAQQMCLEMIKEDLLDAKKHSLLRKKGYHIRVRPE